MEPLDLEFLDPHQTVILRKKYLCACDFGAKFAGKKASLGLIFCGLNRCQKQPV